MGGGPPRPFLAVVARVVTIGKGARRIRHLILNLYRSTPSCSSRGADSTGQRGIPSQESNVLPERATEKYLRHHSPRNPVNMRPLAHRDRSRGAWAAGAIAPHMSGPLAPRGGAGVQLAGAGPLGARSSGPRRPRAASDDLRATTGASPVQPPTAQEPAPAATRLPVPSAPARRGPLESPGPPMLRRAARGVHIPGGASLLGDARPPPPRREFASTPPEGEVRLPGALLLQTRVPSGAESPALAPMGATNLPPPEPSRRRAASDRGPGARRPRPRRGARPPPAVPRGPPQGSRPHPSPPRPARRWWRSRGRPGATPSGPCSSGARSTSPSAPSSG